MPLVPLSPLIAFGIVVQQAQKTPPIQPSTQDVQLTKPVTLPPPPGKSVVPARPITAEEAAAIALYNQPSLVQVQAGVLAAHGAEVSARSLLGPNLVLSSTYFNQSTLKGAAGNSATAGHIPGYQSSLTLDQLLFDFNRTRDLAEQAQDLYKAAGNSLSVAQAEVVVEVKQAFYNFVQNQRLVEVEQADVKSRQDQLGLTQARLNVGTGEPADVVTAKTSLDDAMQSLSLAQSAALSSRVALALAMGVDPRTPIQANESSEPEDFGSDLNALVDQALKDRPEVHQVQAALDAAGLGVDMARVANAPSLGLSLGLGAHGDPNAFATQTGSLSLTLTWTLGDAGYAAGKLEEASAAKLQVQALLIQTQQQVVSDVAQAYVALKSAEQRLAIAQAEVANATEAVRLAQGRYQAQLATFVDVTTAQAALIAAQSNQVIDLVAVQQARSQMARAIGRAPVAVPPQP